jgi:ADP-ribose pyrophosphatase
MTEGTFAPWKTRSRRTVLDCGKFLKVEAHTVELPDGRVIEDWMWVISPDYINVVAETAAGEYLCFRQTKYAIDGTSLAPVGGYIEPGEAPLVAAKRELLEETGYEATDWTELGAYPVEANRGVQTAHFFLARGAWPVAPPTADDLEEQQLLRLSRGEMAAALAAGEFKVLSWAAIVALALLRQERHVTEAE